MVGAPEKKQVLVIYGESQDTTGFVGDTPEECHPKSKRNFIFEWTQILTVRHIQLRCQPQKEQRQKNSYSRHHDFTPSAGGPFTTRPACPAQMVIHSPGLQGSHGKGIEAFFSNL